jgi:hypothetical protein
MAAEALQQHCNGRNPGAVRSGEDKVAVEVWTRGKASQLPAERNYGARGLAAQQETARWSAINCRAESRAQSGAGGGRKGRFSQGPVCKTEEIQGLYGKLIFPNDTKI